MYWSEFLVLFGSLVLFILILLSYIWVNTAGRKAMEAHIKGRQGILDDWEVLKDIAKGGYGFVAQARHKVHKKLAAIKRIPCEEDNLENIRNEVAIHSSLKHKNIIEFLGEGREGVNHYLIMDFAPHKNLYHVIHHQGPFEEEKARAIILQVVDGLRYMHSKNIMHGDIKLSNILIGKQHAIKICDMGCAKKVTDETGKKIKFSSKTPGTMPYMAPEIFKSRPHDGLPTDVWSLGVVVIRIGHGTKPLWDKPRKRKDSVFAKWVKDKQGFYNERGIRWNLDIIKRCLCYHPKNRRTMEQIKRCLETPGRHPSNISKWIAKSKSLFSKCV